MGAATRETGADGPGPAAQADWPIGDALPGVTARQRLLPGMPSNVPLEVYPTHHARGLPQPRLRRE